MAHSNRGSARRAAGDGGDASGAIADHDEAIRLLAGLRDRMGAAFPPAWEADLAKAHMSRGNARRDAGDEDGAIADHDDAIGLLAGRQLDRMGKAFPPEWEHGLAMAHTNRGVARDRAGDVGGAIADHDEAVRLLAGLRDRMGAAFPPAWETNLAVAHMNRGVARARPRHASPGDTRGAIPDLNEAIRLGDGLLARSMPHPPTDCLEVWVRARKARAHAREAEGDTRGAEADRAALEAWRAQLEGPAALPGKPPATPSGKPEMTLLPPPLLPGPVGTLGDDLIERLAQLVAPVLGAHIARRPLLVGCYAQAGPYGTTVSALIFVAADRTAGVIDLVHGGSRAALLLPGTPLAGLPPVLDLTIETEGAGLWAALALAGPWTSPVRRVLDSADEIPWEEHEGTCHPALPAIEPARISPTAEGLLVEATWLRGTTLAAGTVRLSADGHIEVLRETTLAERLPVLGWTYDGPFRVAG
jgi:hypothetical protein